MDTTPITVNVPEAAETSAPTAAEVAEERRASGVGVGIAGGICLLIAVAGWALQRDTGWTVGALGLPATTLFAWRMAPRVVAATPSRSRWLAFGLAVRVIVLTDVVITGLFAVLFLVSSFGQSSGESIVWVAIVLFYGLIALPVVGIPLLIIVLPAALLWAALLRFALR
jgi:hypothetical protein